MWYRKNTLYRCYLLLGIIALVALWMPPAAAAGKGQGIQALAITPELLTAAPGSIISLRFRVTNSTPTEEECIETITLPPGWQTIIPPMPYSLASLESTVRIVALQVPQDAPAGKYQISYRVASQGNPALQDFDSTSVVVPAVSRWALLLADKPESVIAGQSYQAIVRIINRGNSEAVTVLTAEETQQHTTLPAEPGTMTIGAGAGQSVTITVPTDAKLLRSGTQRILIKASVGKEVVATLNINVNILVRATAENSSYNMLQTDLTLRLSGDDNGSGLQTTWKGAGALDDAGSRNIDFLLQLPDSRNSGTFGLPDEFHLAYNTRDTNIKLGDQSVAGSLLTDYSHYGRGIGIEHQDDVAGNDMGAYYIGDRWGKTGQKTAGAYFRHNFQPGTWVRGNYVSSSGSETNNSQQVTDKELWSVEAAATLARGQMGVQMEFAGSSAADAVKPANTAYHLEVNGLTGDKGRYVVNRTHAGADFTGNYHDSDYTRAAYNYAVTPQLSANIAYASWQENLEQRLPRTDAPREQLLQASLQWRLPAAWNLGIGIDSAQRSDRLLPVDFDTTTQDLFLRVGHSNADMSWDTEFRLNRQQDQLTHLQTTAQEYRLNGSYRISPEQFVTLYGGYSSHAQESHLLGSNQFVGAAINWTPSARMSLMGYMNANFTNSGTWNQQLAISGRYSLPDQSTISLQVVRGSSASGFVATNTSYVLSYTIPFGIPLSKRKKAGAIRGRVFDATLPNKPGLANVVLSLNGAGAVTNADGEFVFSALPPGQYTLNVDRKSIGLQRITEKPVPIVLTITGRETNTVDIGVISGASLVGAVLMLNKNPKVSAGSNTATATRDGELVVQGDPNLISHSSSGKSASSTSLPEALMPPQMRIDRQNGATGLGNILVELTDGTTVLRRLTDATGRFLFESLHPGLWHLKAYGQNMPSYHYLEQADFEVTLLGDTQAVAYIRVLPTVRSIIMIP